MLFDFKCPCGHKFEAIVSQREEEECVAENGKVVVPCPLCLEVDCDEMGEKIEGIPLTGNMNRHWANQTWNKEKI